MLHPNSVLYLFQWLSQCCRLVHRPGDLFQLLLHSVKKQQETKHQIIVTSNSNLNPNPNPNAKPKPKPNPNPNPTNGCTNAAS